MENQKIDWKKYSKEDRKFLIGLSISNREYVSTVAIFIYSTLISVSALLLSIYSIGVSISGLTNYMIYTGIGILILIGISWLLILKSFRKMTKKWVPELNKQYQEIHKTIHPELFKGGYYH